MDERTEGKIMEMGDIVCDIAGDIGNASEVSIFNKWVDTIQILCTIL